MYMKSAQLNPWHMVLACLWLVMSLATPAFAATKLEPLSPSLAALTPVSLLPVDKAGSFVFTDGANPDNPGSFTRVADTDGQMVFRAVNTKGSTKQNGINARWLNATAIKKGDTLYARFYARALVARQESGEAEGFFFFQSMTPNTERDFAQAISVGPDWTLISSGFTALRDYAPGEVAMFLAFANLEQTLEFGAFDVVNFGAAITATALPITSFSYAGREANAPWRVAALARIEELRTAPINVRVLDRRGRPVRGANVQVDMVRSAFLWGSSVSAERLTDTDRDSDIYRQKVIDLFDVTVIENGFKWPRWVDPPYRARALTSLEWLRAQGKLVKGHNLAWPSWRFTPSFIANDPAARANIANLNDAHIREILAATKGKLIGWDVVNEPINESAYYEYMPRTHVAEWFKIAQASDPNLQLTLNDYGLLNRSSSPIMAGRMLDFARLMKDNGARVDILGAQGHVGQTPRAPASVLSDLDILGRDGHQIQITEFDMNTRDEQLQADYTRDFLIALYSHRSVTGLIMWGFWENEHWKKDAAMFRPDWTPKPNLAVWQDLVRRQWRTQVRGATSRSGQLEARGHLGTYRVTATHRGRTGTVDFDLTKSSPQVAVTLN
jgi:endo-1,4-beta-xylanase